MLHVVNEALSGDGEWTDISDDRISVPAIEELLARFTSIDYVVLMLTSVSSGVFGLYWAFFDSPTTSIKQLLTAEGCLSTVAVAMSLLGSYVSAALILGLVGQVEKAYEILRQLTFVYVSHIHADHHLGLFSIIKRRQQAGVKSKLTVIGPKFIPAWFARYSNDFELLECDHMDCQELLLQNRMLEQDFDKLSVRRITTCEVDHCPDAFGVRVDLSDYSIVYSGDTRPCERLVQLGQNCDLLIHEATMEDYLADDAKLKGHSTTSQAKEIGRRMNAKFTLLTHFSQRYAKLPLIDDSLFEDGRLGLAFDYMTLRPKNLHVLPHIYPMLKCLYLQHFECMQEKTQKLINKEQAVLANSTA